MEISKDKLLWMYERMQLIRTFENRVKVEFGKGKFLDSCTCMRRRGRRGRYLHEPH